LLILTKYQFSLGIRCSFF